MKTEARDSEGSRVGSLDIRGTRVGQQGEGSRKREKQQRRWKFSKQAEPADFGISQVSSLCLNET